MAGAISLEDEGEGEDVDDPKYAKFSRGLENEVGALGYAYSPSPTPAPSGHLKIKMAAINGKTRYILTISRKNRGL